jgi:hypothetical protein
VEGASYCRGCGANISLLPQALSGQLPQTNGEKLREHRSRRRHQKECSPESAFRNIFMGIAFMVVAIALSRTIGYGWWFWMLIPAFSLFGTGIAQWIRLKEEGRRGLTPGQIVQPPTQMAPPPRVTAFPNPQTGELVEPPASVTEGTTRTLGSETQRNQEAQTRHFDAPTK